MSLGALEEELLLFAKKNKWFQEGKEEKPQLAIAVLEKDIEKPILVLFTVFPIKKEDVNAALQAIGFSRIIKIGEVRLIDEIPMTGTGKIQYRRLNEMV